MVGLNKLDKVLRRKEEGVVGKLLWKEISGIWVTQVPACYQDCPYDRDTFNLSIHINNYRSHQEAKPGDL